MPHQIPHFQLQPDHTVATVTRWGVADGLIFSPGDRLLLSDDGCPDDEDPDDEGALLMLRPRGFGSVMLGRRVGGRLLGEPGGVPASPIRWESVGHVIAVERPLDTSRGSFHVLGTGHWLLPPGEAASKSAPAPEHDLRTRDLSWVTLDRLLQRLQHGLLQHRLQGGLVVGRSLQAAVALPPRVGWIRYVLLPPSAAVVSGPWSTPESTPESTPGTTSAAARLEKVRYSKAG